MDRRDLEPCDHCYAETFAERWRGIPGHPYQQGFDVRLWPGRLDRPLRWRRPRRIFVNSMLDLFHPDVPTEFIAQVFAVMTLAAQHTFQILTKRPGRMASLLGSASFAHAVLRAGQDRAGDQQEWLAAAALLSGPLPNVWLGVSVEDQRTADLRIPKLLDTPAAVRFLSCEPLLGPIELRAEQLFPATCPAGCGCRRPDDADAGECGCDGACTRDDGWTDRRAAIDWVIVGGESGPGARPLHPIWACDLRDQCVDADVAFFFKQWGEWEWVQRWPWPSPGPNRGTLLWTDGTRLSWPDDRDRFTSVHEARRPDGWPAAFLRRVGKKAAGRELDGRTWDQHPQPAVQQPPKVVQ